MVLDIFIDGLSYGNLVEEAAGVLLDSLLVKFLSRIEIISQAVDLRKLGIKLFLPQIEFLPVFFIDFQSLLLDHLHRVVLLGVFLN